MANNKIVSGTKDIPRTVTIIKAVGGNIKKIRCPRCKQQAHPHPDGRGGSLLRCPGCGNKFTMQTI